MTNVTPMQGIPALLVVLLVAVGAFFLFVQKSDEDHVKHAAKRYLAAVEAGDYAEVCRLSTQKVRDVADDCEAEAEASAGELFASRLEGLSDSVLVVRDLDDPFADVDLGVDVVFAMRREGDEWLVDEPLDRVLELEY